MSTAQQLAAEIEVVASKLGISPSTVGERAGQGGRFYARLKDGKRVWPETAEKVRDALTRLIADHSHDNGCDASHIQASEAEKFPNCEQSPTPPEPLSPRT